MIGMLCLSGVAFLFFIYLFFPNLMFCYSLFAFSISPLKHHLENKMYASGLPFITLLFAVAGGTTILDEWRWRQTFGF